MIKYLFAFLLFGTIGLDAQILEQPVDLWRRFQDYEGGFSVMSPDKMTQKVDTVSTNIGDLTYHTFFYQSPVEKKADNLFYMVSYVDYPEGAMHEDSTEILEEFFQETIQTAVLTVDGKLVYDTPIEVDKHKGWQWRIDYLEDGATIRTKGFMVKNRYYSLQTVALKGKHLNRAGEEFLDSFELLSDKGD